MFFTYILKSQKDNRRYIGHTSDLGKRLESHNLGLTPSTKNRRPLTLICYKPFDTKTDAAKYERYLKSLKGGNQLDIEMLIMNKPL